MRRRRKRRRRRRRGRRRTGPFEKNKKKYEYFASVGN